MLEPVGANLTVGREVDLESGATISLGLTSLTVELEISFGPPTGSGVAVADRDGDVAGLLVDRSELGWVGVFITGANTLVVMDSLSNRLRLCLPLRREPSGDTTFRTAQFYRGGERTIFELETTLVSITSQGSVDWLIPHSWPQVRVTGLDQAKAYMIDDGRDAVLDLSLPSRAPAVIRRLAQYSATSGT